MLEEGLSDKVYRVASSSNIHKVSEAVYKAFMEGSCDEVQAIGGGAVNQAVKAITIARSKLAQAGIDIAFIPGFRDIPDTRREDKGTISAINFKLFRLRY